MLGVLVNTATVLIGSCLGLLLKKGIPQRLSDAVMKAIALCTLYIGWSGSLKGENTLVLILSLITGALLGSWLRLDDRLTDTTKRLETKLVTPDSGASTLAEGFLTASMVFCVGSMTVVGSLQAGLSGNNETLYTKATLDLITSAVFAAALGIGVMLAAATVLVVQGGIVLLAQLLAPMLTDVVVAEITCVGSVLIFALGLNLLGLTKFKMIDYLPALLMPLLFCLILV